MSSSGGDAPAVSSGGDAPVAAARSLVSRSHGSGSTERCGCSGPAVSGIGGFFLRGLTVGCSLSRSMRATLAACLSAFGQLTWQFASGSSSVSVSLPLTLRFMGPISPLSACVATASV